MSLLQDLLNPDDDSVAMGTAPEALAGDPDDLGVGDLPDLGLGSLSAEDIKWVDLEFLDLASGPPENKNKNKNPNPGFNNFPDIFFGDSFPSSSLLNANLDDLKPFGSDFKTDLGVDLDVDKNILADLFPPSATIERNADEEDDTEANKVDKTQGHFTATSMDKVLSSVSTKEFEFQSGRKKGSSSKSSRSLKKSGSLSAAVEPTLTKVNVEPSREPARVTIFAADDSFIGMSNNIQVLPNDFQKVSKLLEPLNLESLSVLSPMDIKLEDMKSLKPLVPHKALVPSKFKEVALVKDQMSVRKLAENGINVDGLLCATTETGKKMWLCPEKGCKKSFSRPSLVKIHLFNHKDVKPFKCPQANCSWSFVTNSKLQRHLRSHSKLKQFQCSVSNCSVRFSTAYNLQKHLKLHTREPKFKCIKTCQEQFKTEQAFIKHQETVQHLSPQIPCPESDCDTKLFTEGHVKSHLRRLHEERDAHVCPFTGCGRAFQKPSEMRAHFRNHTGSRPFLCQFPKCSWTFKTASKLRRHEQTHQKIRNHKCDICQKSYLRSEHLREHMVTHNAAKHLMCPFNSCGANVITNKSDLYDHVKRHKDRKEFNSETRFRCVIVNCKKTTHPFVSRQELCQHLLSCHKAEFMVPSGSISIVSLLGISDPDPPSSSKVILVPGFSAMPGTISLVKHVSAKPRTFVTLVPSTAR